MHLMGYEECCCLWYSIVVILLDWMISGQTGVMMLVTVIIPIYNGSEYIESLYDQIIGQTYRNLEVVFVNDGSEDDSSDKIRRLFSDDMIGEEIKVRVIDQVNSGQGSARNRGIEEATGEYLAFVDQDDRIECDYIERLLSVSEGTNADIVISGYLRSDLEGNVKQRVKLTNDQWCRFMNIAPWGKLYRRVFIQENGIKFLPVPLGEDIYFNVSCYLRTSRVCYADYVGYSWSINEKSVTNTLYSFVTDEVSLLPLFEAVDKKNLQYKWKNDEQYQYFFLKTAIYHLFVSARGTDKTELIRYKDRLFEWMDENFPDIGHNSLVGISTPRGEELKIRLIVWGYVRLHKLHLDNMLLRIIAAVRGLTH